MEEKKARWDEEMKLIRDQISLEPMDADIQIICGMDISFIKDNEEDACVGIVFLDFESLKEIYSKYEMVKLNVPYIAGYLAFREVPPLVDVFNKCMKEHPEYKPQVIIVDSNGTLHPRGCGMACHLGVELGIPTIGSAKSFLFVNGIDRTTLLRRFSEECDKAGDSVSINLPDGKQVGVAIKPLDNIKQPIYVSPGSYLTPDEAKDIVVACCEYRIPEPVRLADQGSRKFLRDNGYTEA